MFPTYNTLYYKVEGIFFDLEKNIYSKVPVSQIMYHVLYPGYKFSKVYIKHSTHYSKIEMKDNFNE